MQKRHSISNKSAWRLSAVAVFALLIVTFACQQSKSTPGGAKTDRPDSSSEKAVADASLTAKADSLSSIAGDYSCKCLAGSNQISLQLKKNDSGLDASVEYKAGNFKASGVLHPDTENFDKSFKVWSFTDGKKVYGFQFTHDDHKQWAVSLINEDYKKELNSCTDAKVIDFTRR